MKPSMARATVGTLRNTLPAPSDSLTSRYAKAGITCNSEADESTLIFFEALEATGRQAKEAAHLGRVPASRLSEAKHGGNISLAVAWRQPSDFQVELLERWANAKGLSRTQDVQVFADTAAALLRNLIMMFGASLNRPENRHE